MSRIRSVEEIVKATCRVTGADPKRVLCGHRGSPHATLSRWVAMMIYREQHAPYLITLTEVGVAFDRNRTSVRHGIQKVKTEMATSDLPARDSLFTKVQLIRHNLGM